MLSLLWCPYFSCRGYITNNCSRTGLWMGMIYGWHRIQSVALFLTMASAQKEQCFARDILRVVGYTDWGADRIVLLRLYRGLLHSKLDYGCVAYGLARQSVLKQLDPIHNQGLRIALEAFRTPPAHSLYVEAHEPSPASLRLKRALNHISQSKIFTGKSSLQLRF